MAETDQEYLERINLLNYYGQHIFADQRSQMNEGERFMAKVDRPGGGAYWVTNYGGVFSEGGAPVYGAVSYLGLPPEARQGERTFVDIRLTAEGGYEIRSATGESYHFNPSVNEQAPPPPTPTAPVVGPAPGGPTAPEQPTTPPPPDQADQGKNILDVIRQQFPWAEQVGLLGVIHDLMLDNPNGDQLVSRLRDSDQYKHQMQGIRRSDNSMRFRDEQEFLNWREDVKTVMRRWGRPDYEYDSPEDFVGFAEAEMTNVDEINHRFEIYEQVTKGSDDIKAAFYVYAGKTLTDDELYEAAVNPFAAAQLQDEYNQAVALTPLEWDTWINRATEFALTNVVTKLEELRATGVPTQSVIDQVRAMNPEFARNLVQELALGGSGTNVLSLSELENAFNAAIIGGAAQMNQLEVPTAERVMQFRQAGVDRAKAIQGYTSIAARGQEFSGAAQRAGLGGLSQSDMEDALLIGGGPNQVRMQRALQAEEASGRAGGVAGFGLDQSTNLLTQRGLRRF